LIASSLANYIAGLHRAWRHPPVAAVAITYICKKMAALISQNRRITMDLCMSSDLPTAVFFFSAAGQMEVTYDVCY